MASSAENAAETTGWGQTRRQDAAGESPGLLVIANIEACNGEIARSNSLKIKLQSRGLNHLTLAHLLRRHLADSADAIEKN